MAIESGKEYNPDTAKHLRERRFTFEALGMLFRYTLEIPAYVLARLDTSDTMNRLQEYMTGYAVTVVSDALKGGYLHTSEGEARMREDVGKHLKNYVWERFSITQEKAGQDCWQVAPTLQEVLTV